VRARAAALVLFALVALTLSLVAREPGAHGAATEPPPEPPPAEVHFLPELGLPATEVVAFGASPAESPQAPTEAWAYGYLGDVPPAGEEEQVDRYTLLEHGADGTWQRVPLPVGPTGKVPERPDIFPAKLGALAGQSTPAGSVTLLTGAGIVLRDPGAAPRLVPPPSGAELLGAGETLPPAAPPEGAPTPYSVYDPAPGKAGLMIAPYGDAATPGKAPGAVGPGVLDYDGAAWTREPIEAGGEPVHPLAIACGPTTNPPTADPGEGCWLLAEVGTEPGHLTLFRRGPAPPAEEESAIGEGEGPGGEGEGPKEGEGPGEGGKPPAFSWAPVSVENGLLGGQSGPGAATLSALPGNTQMLTATSQGIWVDFGATLVAGGEPSSASELVEPTGSGTPPSLAAKVAGSWCYPTGPGCKESLGGSFPIAYRSFAWPGASAEDPGRRIVTGLPGRAVLELSSKVFSRAAGAGGSPGIAPGGAAFTSPESGFVADGIDPDAAPDGAGQSQVIAVTTEPPAAQTAVEPVPFRQPLNAVAMNPDGNGEAIAVGANGEFAHYSPVGGWRQDSVSYVNDEEGTGNLGVAGKPGETLLGVAWPTAERAYAVGQGGGIWTWTPEDGVWTPLFQATPAPLNGIAFSASNPSRGFAVGSPNIFHLNNPTRWGSDLEKAPMEDEPETAAVFTSVAFAGEEAIATWHQGNTETGVQKGGISVEGGGGWEVEPEVDKLVSELTGQARWPTKVAGLADGGAVVAGPGFVLKRESTTAPWQFSAEPLPEAGNIAALGAYRDSSGAVRAVVAIDMGPRREVQPTHYGGTAEPLPASGYLLRETADGWTDLEHQALPVEEGSTAMPARPEPALALAVSEDGESMLAVGGQTGVFNTSVEPKGTEYETAAAIRLPASAAIDPDVQAPVSPPAAGRPTLAIAGQAACAAPCADQAEEGLAPDTLLTNALTTAAEIAATGPRELRAFVYTGGRLEPTTVAPDYGAEMGRLASLFSAAAPLPLLTTPSPDLLAGGETAFSTAFAGFGPRAGSTSYYAFRSEPQGRPPLEVVVLDLSTGTLGTAQETWLRKELETARQAGVTVVAVGNASPEFILPDPPAGIQAPTQMEDQSAVASILIEGGAVAYFFDYPGATVFGVLSNGVQGLPAIGTGTLGYGRPAPGATDWLGSSSFLLAEVQPAPSTTRPAGVLVRSIPNISSLVLHGIGGQRLAAGEAETFEGLGRLPAGGVRMEGESGFAGPEPYVTFPFPSPSLSCEGVNCAISPLRDYYFNSSDPSVGEFVSPGSPADSEGQRPTDPLSGFFCARSPGTTTVSITAGGLSYSEPIEVTEGEVGDGCRLPVPVLETSMGGPVVETAPAEPAAEPPPPPVHHQVVPTPGVTPHHAPTPAHHSPPQAHQVPRPPAPTPAPTSPTPQTVRPVVSPHPAPGVQPAPPTGVSSQPVPQTSVQPGTQPVSQAAPAPGVAPAPGMAPDRVGQEEVATQRSHLAVRVRRPATAHRIPATVHHIPATATAMRAGAVGNDAGSASLPLAGALGIVGLLALAGGAGVAASGRGDRRAYAAASLTRRSCRPRRREF
jgi:hypothetical protein